MLKQAPSPKVDPGLFALEGHATCELCKAASATDAWKRGVARALAERP